MNQHQHLRRLFITIFALLVFHSSSLPAQDAKPDPEDVKAAIGVVRDRIDRQVQRVSDLSKEILRLDSHIEGSVARIVQDISSIGDSADSRTEVAKLKEKAVEGLKRSIAKYQRARSQVELTLKNSKDGQSQEDLKGDLKQFEGRIENRVSQIISISKSLTTEKDFKGYEKYLRDTRYDGHYFHRNLSRKVTEEKTQNRRVTQVTDKQRLDIINALKRSITSLNNQNVALKSQMSLKINASNADIFQEDINSNLQAIVTRKKQLESMMKNQQTRTIPINRRAAREKENMIRDEANTLRRDVDTLFRHYFEFQRERKQQNDLMQQLKELEGMLQ